VHSLVGFSSKNGDATQLTVMPLTGLQPTGTAWAMIVEFGDSGQCRLLALNGPHRLAGRSLILGPERTCRTGRSGSQFDPNAISGGVTVGTFSARASGHGLDTPL
jgi:hypothetical protein